MELLACKRAAQLADEVNAAHIHIKMDWKEIVRKLQSTERDLSILARSFG